MTNPFFAQPDTLVSTAAPYEDTFNKYEADPTYFLKRAQALTFCWDEQSLVVEGGLKKVLLGEGRYSTNGILYRQLHTPNPNKLIYHVAKNQFRARLNGQDEFGDFEKGFDIVIEDARRTPGGVLVVVKRDIDGLGYELARNCKGDLVSGSGVNVALGKPVIIEEPRGSKAGNLLRKASTKLFGKHPIKR